MNDLFICIPIGLAVMLIFLAIAIFQTLPKKGIPENLVFIVDDPNEIARLAGIVEQRKYNRGKRLHQEYLAIWKPGVVYELDRSALFLINNPGYGVTVQIEGDINDSLSKGMALTQAKIKLCT